MTFAPARVRLRNRSVEFTVATALVLIACWSCQVSLSDLIHGFNKGAELLTLFFPPAWSQFWHLLGPAAATVGLAGIATPIGAALSLPVALAAARNISPRWLNLSTRLSARPRARPAGSRHSAVSRDHLRLGTIPCCARIEHLKRGHAGEAAALHPSFDAPYELSLPASDPLHRSLLFCSSSSPSASAPSRGSWQFM
jgi:hypothetical protein